MKREDKIDAINKMIENINMMSYSIDGLCILSRRLSYPQTIPYDQSEWLDSIIKMNRPKEVWAKGEYFWQPGLIPPRLKFLKMLLKKTKEGKI